jgi:hypothetical protein
VVKPALRVYGVVPFLAVIRDLLESRRLEGRSALEHMHFVSQVFHVFKS